MTTPIADFLRGYAASGMVRMHMPGHKGEPLLGAEPYDLTECAGADSLYEAEGIIAQSEENASRLFGGRTFYSAEGSSLSIRAMVWLLCRAAAEAGKKPLILAGRNAHHAFLSAVSLLDVPVSWLYGKELLSCLPSAEEVEEAIRRTHPTAVYLTCPDYLGEMCDLAAISRVCKRNGVLLAVDNAHGAYLKFLPHSLHPLDLGADICCDSAHKTLPVLTGGGYLHITKSFSESVASEAKRALALFGSTSPSYLILASLDLANRYLAEKFAPDLAACVARTAEVRRRLAVGGYGFLGEEPMKLTIAAKGYGYTGEELANALLQKGICVEFADPDYLVLMPSVKTSAEDMERVLQTLLSIPRKESIKNAPPPVCRGEAFCSPRAALCLPAEKIAAENSVGRILADMRIGCPPAVPILISGERITQTALAAFRYYGVKTVSVLCAEEASKVQQIR